MFYFRYTDSAGRQDQVAIGTYDSKGRTGLSLKQSRDKAGELSRRYQGGEKDLRAHLENTGAVPVRLETVSAAVGDVTRKMVEAKTAREHFELRDIRRTCETMLAGMGVSRDLRAQLLSHGLAGVQVRHYDRHDYMDEKRAALHAWDARLLEIAEGKRRGGNVVAISRKSA